MQTSRHEEEENQVIIAISRTNWLAYNVIGKSTLRRHELAAGYLIDRSTSKCMTNLHLAFTKGLTGRRSS